MATCVHISLSGLLGIIHPLLSSPKLVSMSEVDPFFEELPFAPIAPLLALYIQPNMFTRGLMLGRAVPKCRLFPQESFGDYPTD